MVTAQQEAIWPIVPVLASWRKQLTNATSCLFLTDLKCIIILIIFNIGGTVVSTAASQRQEPGCDSQLRSLPVRSLYILPVSVWVSSRCSGFLPQSKDVRDRLIG